MPRKSIKDQDSPCRLCMHFKAPNREHSSSKGKNSKEQNFLAVVSYYSMFSTSLDLPSSPAQFLGRSQDPLLEKHHHVPAQHQSGILPAIPPDSSATNIPAHRASNLWSMPKGIPTLAEPTWVSSDEQDLLSF